MVQDKKSQENEEQEKPKAVLQMYKKRLSILKVAHQNASQDNLVKAVEGYHEYLRILAKYNDVKEENLRPTHFDSEKEVAEIMMVSQVYWGLAKAYDRNVKFQREAQRYLDQFVKFSIGFKFQYLNSKMLKKFIDKRQAYNPKMFSDAHRQIQVDSKKCYIATFCYSENHPNVALLREFKKSIVETYLGFKFVETYYKVSPALIAIAEKNFLFKILIKTFFIPFIYFFTTILRRFNSKL